MPLSPGRIDGAEERDQQHEGEVLDIGKREAGRRHQAGAGEQQVAQVVRAARRTPTTSVSSDEPSSAAVATTPISSGLKPIAVR